VGSFGTGRRLLQDASEAFAALATQGARETTQEAAKAAGAPESSAAAAAVDVAAAASADVAAVTASSTSADLGEARVAAALSKARRYRGKQQPRRQPFKQLYKGWGGSYDQLKQYKPPSWYNYNTYRWQGQTYNWQQTRSSTTDATCTAQAAPAAALCVDFGDGGAPLQLVTGSVTAVDPVSGFTGTANVRVTVWNVATDTKPMWIPDFCVDASTASG
jgi:hypothetical protein